MAWDVSVCARDGGVPVFLAADGSFESDGRSEPVDRAEDGAEAEK